MRRRFIDIPPEIRAEMEAREQSRRLASRPRVDPATGPASAGELDWSGAAEELLRVAGDLAALATEGAPYPGEGPSA